MVKQLIEGDRLFFIAESLAKDFSLFPQVDQEDRPVPGLLSQRDINRRQEALREYNIDAYIEAVVAPAAIKPAAVLMKELDAAMARIKVLEDALKAAGAAVPPGGPDAPPPPP